MGDYLKLFETTSEYETYIEGQDAILPNVSYCEDNNGVHYNPYVPPTILVTKYNITNTSTATNIMGSSASSLFSEIEIDGVKQSNITTTYTFDTTGEHTIKYTLVDPTSIGDNAFKQCTAMTEIIIPNNILTIGASVFVNCDSLTSINIPYSVTSLGQGVFNACSNLEHVTIGSGITSIGEYAFYLCEGTRDIRINSNIAPTLLGNNIFYEIKRSGTLYVPQGSTGYDTFMQNANYYLGKYNWTKVEQ